MEHIFSVFYIHSPIWSLQQPNEVGIINITHFLDESTEAPRG